MKSGLIRFSSAWLFMWALSYLAVAVLAPDIGGGAAWDWLIFVAFGIFLIVGTIFANWSSLRYTNVAGRIILFVLAVISVGSGIASWTGLQTWLVPFANKEIFQVSMAFADLISATFMIALALDPN